MTPVETGKVTDGIYAIRDTYINMYVVRYDSGYILIDGGNHLKTIEKAMVTLNINPEKVKAIFLTHTDADHVASISLFPFAEVYLSIKEVQLIDGEKSRFFIFGNNINKTNYKVLEDGQTINFPGLSVKGILAPGHTPGSICYLVNGKYLFTGDVLRFYKGKVAAFSRFINMDTKMDRKSIDKLKQLKGIEYILSAHYGVSNDFEFAFRDWGKK